jgi:hypothetical protein
MTDEELEDYNRWGSPDESRPCPYRKDCTWTFTGGKDTALLLRLRIHELSAHYDARGYPI